jgi:uncharacterized delta-60 repeat protein
MKKIILINLIFNVFLFFGINAQVGSIDPNFNLGTGFGPDNWTGKCDIIVQQPDGKLLIGGQFKTYNGEPALYITRLNIDGTRDNSFSSPIAEGWGYKIRAIALQNDGKIIVAGTFQVTNGVTQNNIARLNNNGTLDVSFAPLAGFNQEVHTVAIQSDGKIIVGGLFSVFDPPFGGLQISVNGIARFNANGSLDNTFNIGNGFYNEGTDFFGQRNVHKILIQADGKIIVTGYFSHFNGNQRKLIARLNTDGSLDNTFNANNNFAPSFAGNYGQIYALKLLSNGKMMIGGNYGNDNSNAKGVDKLNSDGSLDATFAISHSSDLRCFTLDVQSDGKVIAGNVNFGLPSEAYVIERYNSDGTLDESFEKTFVNNEVKEVIVQNDGNITFVGYFNYNPTGIMRLIGDTPATSHIKEYSKSNYKIYPNPASKFITISELQSPSEIFITDLSGKEVFVNNHFIDNEIKINLDGLIEGVYFIKIKQNESYDIKKIILNQN